MPRAAELFQVVEDPRMTCDAVRLVLHYASKGPGPHPYDRTAASLLLDKAGEGRITRAHQVAEAAGYLKRKRGGKGHSDSFTVHFRPIETATLKPELEPVYDRDFAGSITPDRTGETAALKDRPSISGGLNGPHTRETSPSSVRQEGDRQEEPPIVPLSAAAEKALTQHAKVLEGSRGALRDYLAIRVPPPQQMAYVHRVACMLEDPLSTFRIPNTGALAPPEVQLATLSAALNELLATDEKMMKWPSGDVRNLRTKIEILLKQRGDNGNRRTNDSGPGGEVRSEARRGSQLSHLS